MKQQPKWCEDRWHDWADALLRSYQRWCGHSLIERTGNVAEDRQRLWRAPFVVVAHANQTDPVLVYGNECALKLWEMTPEQWIQTPSRLTAEPMHRDERARLLTRTHELGFVDDYQGIRISRTGMRFQIHRATVWNVLDESETLIGQAATFAKWTFLGDSARPPAEAQG